MRVLNSALAVLALSMLATESSAYTYGPTSRAEWDGWPEYCKARYSVSGESSSSEYVRDVPPGSADLWKERIGPCFGMLHHYCGGLLALNRAKAALTAADKRWQLEKAINEDMFAAASCPSSDPFSANIETHLAMVYAEQGKEANALELLDGVIKAHPTYANAYIVKAMRLKKAGKASDALDLLVLGSDATDGASAELENALGFAYLNAKDYEKARVHARKAYALGFPLPGLRDQLARAGFPL